MKRDTTTLVSWEQVAAALDEEPNDSHGRDWFDAYMLFCIVFVTVLSAVGAWTVARWLWGMA